MSEPHVNVGALGHSQRLPLRLLIAADMDSPALRAELLKTEGFGHPIQIVERGEPHDALIGGEEDRIQRDGDHVLRLNPELPEPKRRISPKTLAVLGGLEAIMPGALAGLLGRYSEPKQPRVRTEAEIAEHDAKRAAKEERRRKAREAAECGRARSAS